jgi:hypothetical protein
VKTQPIAEFTANETGALIITNKKNGLETPSPVVKTTVKPEARMQIEEWKTK